MPRLVARAASDRPPGFVARIFQARGLPVSFSTKLLSLEAGETQELALDEEDPHIEEYADPDSETERRSRILNFVNHRGRRVSVNELKRVDLTTISNHFLATDDLIDLPVATLDEHIGFDLHDEI